MTTSLADGLADTAADLIARATSKGADAADVIVMRGLRQSVDWRLGKLESVDRSEACDLGLRVFVGQRQASVSSTDFAAGGFDELVDRALAMARIAPADPYAGLADPVQFATAIPDLDLMDGDGDVEVERLTEWAREAEEAALAVEGVSNSEGGSAGCGRSEVVLATSNGFVGGYAGSSFSVACSVLAGSAETGMERAYDSCGVRHREDLMSPAAIGASAGEQAVARLGPRKVSTRQVPVVFDKRIAGSLIGHFLGAISGSAIARKSSFLLDRMGQPVFAPGIGIIDDPLRPRGLRSKPFDGEGVRTQRSDLVREGTLATWLLDCGTARQLGLTTTGHAARGVGGPPAPSATNVHMTPGRLSLKELIADFEEGYFVTSLMGQGVNGVTGDYSRGSAGFWIENGEIAYPVSEVTIAGNLKDMFLNLTPADDLEFRYGVNAPSVRIEGMTVAGA